MHALDRQLNALAGDLLLLAETRPRGPALVRYAMWFRVQRPAASGETERIWNYHWDTIIEGEGCSELTQAFSPEQEKVSSKSYGQGGPFVYVEPIDADEFRRRGLLRPVLLPQ